MPAGVSWSQYIKFTAAAMLSMFAGSQAVHTYYKPMEDIDFLIKEELAKIEAEEAANTDNNHRDQ